MAVGCSLGTGVSVKVGVSVGVTEYPEGVSLAGGSSVSTISSRGVSWKDAAAMDSSAFGNAADTGMVEIVNVYYNMEIMTITLTSIPPSLLVKWREETARRAFGREFIFPPRWFNSRCWVMKLFGSTTIILCCGIRYKNSRVKF
jgi:hypothetical protein